MRQQCRAGGEAERGRGGHTRAQLEVVGAAALSTQCVVTLVLPSGNSLRHVARPPYITSNFHTYNNITNNNNNNSNNNNNNNKNNNISSSYFAFQLMVS